LNELDNPWFAEHWTHQVNVELSVETVRRTTDSAQHVFPHIIEFIT